MSDRRPLPSWLLAAVFATSMASVPLTVQALRRPIAPPPRTIAELMTLLHQSDPPLYAVSMTDLSPEVGVYFCERLQPRQQLQHLHRVPECAGRWRGVVFCGREDRLGETSEVQLHDWGEHAMRIGSFLFFGDPALLRRIRAALPDE
jgi:hypothetical protein